MVLILYLKETVNLMIQISLKGLVKFMIGGPANQRNVLKDFKYPDPEGHAQTVYYREARTVIRNFHRDGNNLDFIERESRNLDVLARQSNKPAIKTRYQHNARAIRQYACHFSDKNYIVLPEVRLGLTFGDVIVTVIPDLHVQEKQKEIIIKLDFSKNALDGEVYKIMSQAMFEAQQIEKMELPSTCVMCLDVPRGVIYKARSSSRIQKEMEAACANISAIWTKI